jgi:hypothetical protein
MKEKFKESIRIICWIIIPSLIVSLGICYISPNESYKEKYLRLLTEHNIFLKEYNDKFKDNIEKSKSNLDSFKLTIDTIYINNIVRVNKIQYIKQKQLKNREYVDSLFNSIKFDIDTCDTLYLRLYNQVLKEIEKQ